jgi:hypothetical protein
VEDESFDERVAFEVEGETLTVRDVIEGQRLRINADREPTLSPALPELFPLPVDGAVSFEAGIIAVPEYASINVRDDDGKFLAQLDEATEFSRGSYCIEINGGIKTIFRVTDAEISATGTVGPEPVEFTFDRATTVTVGGRSLHSRPEATITVPDDPTALTEAVSVLGSSIKEFSPERSWPTLRGYPPRIERGDSLDIPSPLTVPDTGVEVVVRPTYADVYRLSTLSYYLGARMTVGDAPVIRLENGYEERLPTEGSALERRVEELLRTWFVLDTLARTEGYVPSDRVEYDEIGGLLPFYPPNLADMSMSERLMEYLEVDAETVAHHAPAWPTVATLRPGPAGAEFLPHLAHTLAPIRVRGTAEPARRDAPLAVAVSPRAVSHAESGDATADAVRSPDSTPVSATTSILTPSAFENRLRREISDRGDIRVVFLLDSTEREQSIRNRLTTPAVPDGIGSWSVLTDPDRDAISGIFADGSVDIVYCGLPVRNGAIITDNGRFEVDHLDRPSEFERPALLVVEDSSSTEIGVSAVESGSLGAVILNETLGPARVRRLLSLLSLSGPIPVATELALYDSDHEARYVGDPAGVVSTDRGMPLRIAVLRSVDQSSFVIDWLSFISTESLPGGETWTLLDDFDAQRHLIGTRWSDSEPIDADDVLTLHGGKEHQICLNGDLVLYGDDLTAEDITASARRALSDRSETESNVDSRR